MKLITGVDGEHTDGQWALFYNPFHEKHGEVHLSLSPEQGFSWNTSFGIIFYQLISKSIEGGNFTETSKLLDLFRECFSEIQKHDLGHDTPELYGSITLNIIGELRNIGQDIDFFIYEKIQEIIDMLYANFETNKTGFLHGVSWWAENKTM